MGKFADKVLVQDLEGLQLKLNAAFCAVILHEKLQYIVFIVFVNNVTFKSLYLVTWSALRPAGAEPKYNKSKKIHLKRQ